MNVISETFQYGFNIHLNKLQTNTTSVLCVTILYLCTYLSITIVRLKAFHILWFECEIHFFSSFITTDTSRYKYSLRRKDSEVKLLTYSNHE